MKIAKNTIHGVNIFWITKEDKIISEKIVFIKTFSSQLIDFCFYPLHRYDSWYRCLDKGVDRKIVFDAKVVATVAHLKFIQKLIFDVVLN